MNEAVQHKLLVAEEIDKLVTALRDDSYQSGPISRLDENSLPTPRWRGREAQLVGTQPACSLAWLCANQDEDADEL